MAEGNHYDHLFKVITPLIIFFTFIFPPTLPACDARDAIRVSNASYPVTLDSPSRRLGRRKVVSLFLVVSLSNDH
jgi:hypothetical protein